jgi:hypothetical protein
MLFEKKKNFFFIKAKEYVLTKNMKKKKRINERIT